MSHRAYCLAWQAASDIAPLSHAPTTILQINIGLYCNQACVHCHVESSPLRTEQMSPATIDQVRPTSYPHLIPTLRESRVCWLHTVAVP
jgi:hypothetical protein